MKNFIIIAITITAGYFFWPKTEQNIEVLEIEEITKEVEQIDEEPQAKPKPLPIKKVVKAPKVAPLTPPTKIIQPLAQEASKEPQYKSKTPPKHIEFEINKKGEAIAFGDIYLGKVNNPKGLKSARTKPKQVRLWDTTEIPYFIESKVSQKDTIEATLNYFSEHTNLNFIQNDGTHKDSIVFSKGEEHCYSYLGKTGGHQPIFLSSKCGAKEIAHEIMHAIGFIHEHTRADRDQYVKIVWDNIKKDFQRQFSLAPKEYMEQTLTGFAFSYNSIMLYDPKSFAKDIAKDTIISITDKKLLPVSTILSPDDINRINNTY